MGDFSEDALIEQPAIELLKSMEWDYLNCYNETYGVGGTLGRETPQEVVLTRKLMAAIQKLNPKLPPEAWKLAVEELERDRSAMSPAAANQDVYKLLKDGVKVTFSDPQQGGQTEEKVKVIDWETPTNNDFFLASQFWISGQVYKRRADLVGFVNGLPLAELRKKLSKAKPEESESLAAQIRFMETTDMAVVVSQSQNEVTDFQELGLDITPHRLRMVKEDLETKFKDPEDPLRLVFLCAMWITGFDVPSCSTIYLDKPMRNHTLMQTIARANRVFGGKVNGLIVDYVGVFRDLQKALAIYGGGAGGGGGPVEDKEELVDRLRQAIVDTTAFCEERILLQIDRCH